MNVVFVIARNAGGRPTVMHELQAGTARNTLCGRVMEGWSLCYVPETVARGALRTMRCGGCARRRV
jgi:hypothetical protein